MRIEQLLYITEIAKTGSINNTADRLHVSSPGISIAIRSLEEELQVKIFERSRTGLQPTEIGKKLIGSAQEVLNQIENFKQVAKSDSPEVEGHLIISAVPGICKNIIPKVAAKFHARYPKVTLQIKESQILQVRKDVVNGEADIGIVFSFAQPPEENQLLTTTHLFDSSLMICFNKNSKLANMEFIDMASLKKYPFAFSLNVNDIKEIHSLLFRSTDKPNIIISQNLETKKQFILQGLAIGFEPEFVIKSDPFYQHEDLIVKPLAGFEGKLTYHYVKQKNRYFSVAARELLKALHEEVTTCFSAN